MSRAAPFPDFTLRLDTMTYGGDALGRVEGKAIFVTGGLPGELVRVQVEDDHAHYMRARLIEVLEPSPDRTSPPCPYFGWTDSACGGCHWQHIDYAAQLRFKTAIVREQLQRLGHIPDPPVRDIIPSPAIWQYRNHAQFHVTPQGAWGFQAARSQRVIPIEQCRILELAVQERLSQSHQVSQIDAPRFSVRETNFQPQVSGIAFHVSPESFFQVNTSLIETLVNLVLAKLEARTTDTILDAYCGVGLFSRFLAPQVARVVGIESSRSAQADYAINLAGYANTEFQLGRIEQVLPTLKMPFDAAVFDPPRAGCGSHVLDAVVAQPIDRVVIVACDPATLARDVRYLLDRNYALIEVQPIDLFPHTFHIEAVATLRGPRPSATENA